MTPTQADRVIARLDEMDAELREIRSDLALTRSELAAMKAGLGVGKWVVAVLLTIGGIVVGVLQVLQRVGK